jgi:hypothetical protein
VICEVFQILKSPAPNLSRSLEKHRVEIPATGGNPRNPKIPPTTASGSATRSS